MKQFAFWTNFNLKWDEWPLCKMCQSYRDKHNLTDNDIICMHGREE